MVRDCLATQGSAVPLECAVLSGGLTVTSWHNKLSVQTFESLQLLKSTYWNGHMVAAEQAEEHLMVIWKDTDEIQVDISEDNGDGEMGIWWETGMVVDGRKNIDMSCYTQNLCYIL